VIWPIRVSRCRLIIPSIPMSRRRCR
jgi:hypothetical protein